MYFEWPWLWSHVLRPWPWSSHWPWPRTIVSLTPILESWSCSDSRVSRQSSGPHIFSSFLKTFIALFQDRVLILRTRTVSSVEVTDGTNTDREEIGECSLADHAGHRLSFIGSDGRVSYLRRWLNHNVLRKLLVHRRMRRMRLFFRPKMDHATTTQLDRLRQRFALVVPCYGKRRYAPPARVWRRLARAKPHRAGSLSWHS